MCRALLIGLITFAVPAAAAGAVAVEEEEGLTLSMHAHLARQGLPAKQFAPAKLTIKADFQAKRPERVQQPPLSSLRLMLNRHVRFETAGLPQCPLHALRGTTAQEAQARCGNAEVGKGSMRWPIRCSGTRCRAGIPTDGIVAFNGRYRGAPAIFVQATGYEGRSDFVLVFVSKRTAGGSPIRCRCISYQSPSDSITGISLTLGRLYRVPGNPRAYLSASCPPVRVGEIALGSLEFQFADGTSMPGPLQAACS